MLVDRSLIYFLFVVPFGIGGYTLGLLKGRMLALGKEEEGIEADSKTLENNDLLVEICTEFKNIARETCSKKDNERISFVIREYNEHRKYTKKTKKDNVIYLDRVK